MFIIFIPFVFDSYFLFGQFQLFILAVFLWPKLVFWPTAFYKLFVKSFYAGKKVLITGITGFKGAWLALWLKHLGAQVVGLALSPPTHPSFWQVLNLGQEVDYVEGDINDADTVERVLAQAQPEVIFHLAAQALVGESFRQPFATYQTNLLGLLNVLQAAMHCPRVKVLLNVTSDKCYQNEQRSTSAKQHAFKEDDPLGGDDIYSSSKACAEILTAAFRKTYLADNSLATTTSSSASSSYVLATARAGNVIGGGDWAKERLIPDLVRALREDRPLQLRHPEAVRPWQHVLEALSGYLLLAARLANDAARLGRAYNFGPSEETKTVRETVDLFLQAWGSPAGFTAQTSLSPEFGEAAYLALATQKAQRDLGWRPAWDIATSLAMTAQWYKTYYTPSNGSSDSSSAATMRDLSLAQINTYMESAAWQSYGTYL